MTIFTADICHPYAICDTDHIKTALLRRSKLARKCLLNARFLLRFNHLSALTPPSSTSVFNITLMARFFPVSLQREPVENHRSITTSAKENTMKSTTTALPVAAFLSSLLLLSGIASAAPVLNMEIKAEREMTVTDDKGNTRTEKVTADTASPGDTVLYTLTYSNSGDEAAANVKIDNPIPEGNRYLPNSAWGENSELFFSIDGGKTFKKASALTYQIEGNTRTAAPEQYNAVRWVVQSIPAGSSGRVGFSAVVE
jgi:uncharacterized repeat protein (TIGR01451 family)